MGGHHQRVITIILLSAAAPYPRVIISPEQLQLSLDGCPGPWCSWRNLATPLASKEAVSPSRYPYLGEFRNQNCQYQNGISLSLPWAWHISASACYFYFHSFFRYHCMAEFFSIFSPIQNWEKKKSLWLSDWWTEEGFFFLAWRIFLQNQTKLILRMRNAIFDIQVDDAKVLNRRRHEDSIEAKLPHLF